MSEHEGLYSEKRQNEIEEFVSKLANFKPTKIAVEMVSEDSEFCNERYKQYKLGTYQLEMNEIYQVGFRLGLRLNHEQIYPTDWMGKAEMSYQEVEKWAKENQPELLSELYKEFSIPELTESKSVVDFK